MLESLHIRHFQCHERRLIKFSPTLTVLVGDSDRGKTSCLRALRLLCLNQPSGIAFVRHGEEHTNLTLKFDGHKLGRKRGKSVNSYSLDGEEYVAFGQGNVPEAIEKLLCVGDVNFQRQHDSPLWFTLSPGQVSRELNAIIDLSLIDETLANVSAEVRKAKAIADVSEDRLKQTRDERDSLQFAVQMDKELRSLETVQENIVEIEQSSLRIGGLIREATDAQERAVRSSQIESDAVSLLREGEACREMQGRVDLLQSVLKNIEELNVYADMDLPDIAPLETLCSEVRKGEKWTERLRTVLAEIGDARGRFEQNEGEEEMLSAELQILMKGMKQCPVCQQPIPS